MRDKDRVLIIEEKVRDREALRRTLQSNYQVCVAENGRQALELIYKDMIDLVTLDLQLKSIPPIEILKAIRQHDPDIEIVIISRPADLDTTLKTLQYGVNYVPKPFHITEVISVIKASLERRRLNLQLKHILQELMAPDGWIADWTMTCPGDEGDKLFRLARRISYHFIQQQHSKTNGYRDYLEFVKVLISTLESKDTYTHGHSERVAYYSSLIAENLDLLPEEEKDLQIAAYLHDIGKLGMSNILMLKKKRLNAQEWEIIRQHPGKGVDLIEPLRSSKNITAYIRHHHERFDGNGYPYGLAGESIPLGGRIIAIVDAYDAMTSNRPYRTKTMTSGEAQQELIRCAGTQFDPCLVSVFIRALRSNNQLLALA
jgi:response regulator RpfG family c-di-GMP phosphodiesterase